MPLLKQYEKIFSDDDQLKGALELMYVDILDFHENAVHFFRGKGILKNLGRHKDFVEKCAQLAQYQLCQNNIVDMRTASSNCFQQYQQDVVEMNAKLDELVVEQQLEKTKAVIEWLAVGQQAQEDHDVYQKIRSRYSSTVNWILSNEHIKHWMEAGVPAKSVLWMNGIPGAGKTILASAIIDTCRGLCNPAQSRPVAHILQLSEADNESDINSYVKIEVRRIAEKFSPFNEDMVQYLQYLTVHNAKGMFLYAKLVLENLIAQPTRDDLIKGIQRDNFPIGLRGAYERILRSMKQVSSPEEWEKAKKLLGWMICAKRRLTWKEIQVALSIDVDNESIEYDDRRLRRHIHEICGSLVLLNGDRVSLVHSTAKTYVVTVMEDVHAPSIECELAALCLRYLTFPCFDMNEVSDQQELKELVLEGHLTFQDYAVAKWFHHVNAFVSSGPEFMHESPSRDTYLDDMSAALEDFMLKYNDVDWVQNIVDVCKAKCSVFQGLPMHDRLVQLTSHIFTVQQRGFDARHEVSIKSLAAVLERNRKLLEELPSSKLFDNNDLDKYRQFYDHERLFKCTKITCRYFSEGFKDAKARRKHVNIHEQAYEALKDDEKGRERLQKLNSIIKEQLGKPKLKLRSEDGYKQLLKLIHKKAESLEQSKSSEKVGRICKNMMSIQELVAAGANVGGPYIAIPAAALFLAFSMNQIYLSERAAMYKLAETVTNYVVLNAKWHLRVKIQPTDDSDMRDAKDKLHTVYVGLYKLIILASAQLTISLFGSFQLVKNLAKHYDWTGQLEELKEKASVVAEFREELKDWEKLGAAQKRAERPDPRKAMGPGCRNPLHWAAALGVPEQVAFYVQNKEYPINALTPQSWTAAHLAAREGHTRILKMLLTAPGIDLTIKNREGRTPLHIAAIHNRTWAVKLLLERRAKLLSLRDNYDRTAFIIAAEKGHVDVLKALKGYGQDMNEVTIKQGWTALHLAAENGKVNAVKWLAENGTKKWTKVRDGPQKGLTAKEIAEQKGRAKVVELL
ncbi:hypothetical protein N0V95_003669 [Ascochyta clinopodiicola]|nr:hypothetical protein N0V95_003669 [Ascochyta clinopodiicola]